MEKNEELSVLYGLTILVKFMLYQNTILSLESYLMKYNEKEIEDLLQISKANEAIIKRENASGHITASGFVLYEEKILLIFHKKLQKYIQPGGHLENDATVLHAAQREVLEETGVRTTPFKNIITPIHIDIHTIPYHEKKNEIEHKHYDFMFLLTTSSQKVRLQEDEVDSYKWVSLDYPFNDMGIMRAVEKIKMLCRSL